MRFVNLASTTISKGQQIGNLPTPDYDWTFVGWYRNGELVKETDVVNTNWTLFAKWEQQIKKQPTKEDMSIRVDDSQHATYQWFMLNSMPMFFADWQSTNHGRESTSSQTYTFENCKDYVLSFHYNVSSESVDRFTARLNGNVLVSTGGTYSMDYSYVIPDNGQYTLELSYSKDDSESEGKDMVEVNNIMVSPAPQLVANNVTAIQIDPFAEAVYYCIVTYSNSGVSLTSDYVVNYSPKISFADANVKALCVSNWDMNGDGELSEAEAAAVTDLGTVFKNNTQIKSFDELQYFTGITGIGGNAFEGCSGLTSVTIPNSVTSIEGQAFYNCSGLTSVISEIEEPFAFGTNAFNGISSSCALTVPYGTRDAYIAAGWTTNVFKGGIEEMDNPNIISGSCGENVNYSLNTETGLLSITGSGAMADYSSEEEVPWYAQRENIKSVEIADGVTTIGNNAFNGCSGLTSLTMPNSVTSIGGWAFTWCDHLTSFDIPNSVTSIGDHAFERCDNLSSLTIGNSVTSIGISAFEQCSFTSIIIPSSMTSIGHHAFWYCTHLTSIVVADGNMKYDSRDNCNAIIETATNTMVLGCKNTIIPNSVTSIGDLAFSTCTDLTSIEIPSSVKSIGTCAFERCHSLTSVTIPNSVTEIGVWAFSDCNSLTSVAIPNSVTSIQACAFNRTGLTSVEIPNSVTSIEERVFEDCSGLTSIDIPNSVTSIGYAAFNRSGLTSVTIPNSVTLIRELAFSNCSELTEVYCNAVNVPNTSTDAFDNVDLSNATLYVPAASIEAYKAAAPWSGFGTIEPDEKILSGSCGENVNYTLNLETGALSITGTGAMTDYSSEEEVPWSALRGNIKSVEIADGVTTIGSKVFSFTGFASIKIPNSVISIGTEAFDRCALTSIEIPNSVTTIGELAFYGCGLTSVTFGTNVTEIGSYAFWGCGGLTSVEFPNSVKTIRYASFENCPLTSVTIPSSVTLIEARSFGNCPNLTSIVVEDGNTKYDSRDNCNAIIETATNTLVVGGINTVIPNSVTSIGSEAFHSSPLTSIDIPNSVTSIYSYAFVDCSNLTSVDIPNSVTSIGQGAFRRCLNLTSIEIPNSVTYIGGGAFSDCSELTEVYCYAVNVPNTDVTAFDGVDLSNATLYVPAASIEAYQAAEPWSQFGNIMKIDTDISQMDNVMYVESFEGHSASQVIMPIQMKNSAEIRGFQFNLYLPDGVTIALNPKGKEMVSLSPERRDEYDEHTLSVRKQDDGSYLFLCGSLSEDTFLGNDGEIATVTLNIDEKVEDGDYPIILKNIKLTENDISKYYETPQVRSTLSIVSYMLGDINGDGKVDVSDYIGIANHILGDTPEDFIMNAADVDENGVIDVSDYIGVANIILSGSIYGSQQ